MKKRMSEAEFARYKERLYEKYGDDSPLSRKTRAMKIAKAINKIEVIRNDCTKCSNL